MGPLLSQSLLRCWVAISCLHLFAGLVLWIYFRLPGVCLDFWISATSSCCSLFPSLPQVPGHPPLNVSEPTLLMSSGEPLPYDPGNTENIGFDKKNNNNKTKPEQTKKQTRKPKSRKETRKKQKTAENAGFVFFCQFFFLFFSCFFLFFF